MDESSTRDSSQDVDATSPDSRRRVMTQLPPSATSKPVAASEQPVLATSKPVAATSPSAESQQTSALSRGQRRTLLEQARALGLVRAKRRGNANHNPHGRGGFADHPENRSKGGHKRIPNSQRELKALITELANESVPTDEGEAQRLVAMLRGMMSSKSPVDHMEILNRLVGRQASKVDMTSGGAKIGWGAFIALTVAPPSSHDAPLARGGDDAALDGDVTETSTPQLGDGTDADGSRA